VPTGWHSVWFHRRTCFDERGIVRVCPVGQVGVFQEGRQRFVPRDLELNPQPRRHGGEVGRVGVVGRVDARRGERIGRP